MSSRYGSLDLAEAKELFERDYLVQKLRECDYNVAKAADASGIHPSGLHAKIKKLGSAGTMKTLTARQKEVLDFISSFIEQHAYPPTIREIAERFSISVKGAYDHVKALEKKDLSPDSARTVPRALELLGREKTDGTVVEVPLLGAVRAVSGKPITRQRELHGSIYGACRTSFEAGDLLRAHRPRR